MGQTTACSPRSHASHNFSRIWIQGSELPLDSLPPVVFKLPDSEKSSCPQNFCPQFWGRKWLCQFYGHLEKCIRSAGKTMSIKFLVLGGGVFWVFWGGGGSADSIFMGARIFLTDVCSMELPQTIVFFFLVCKGPSTLSALWEREETGPSGKEKSDQSRCAQTEQQ